MSNKLFDLFPPPKFLDIPFAGLSLSDSAIRCLQFGRKRGKLYIEKYKEVPVAPGVIVAGAIHNKEELIKILGEVKKTLSLQYVKVSLPEEKAYLFTTKIPIIKPEEVRPVVESKMEENVPVSPAELIFDYKLIDHRQRGHIDAIVSSLPISVIDTYIEVLSAAGLTPLSLEIESQAITRSLIAPTNLETILIVHFGFEKVGLYVVSNGLVHFTSTLPIQNDALTNPSFLSQEIKKLFVYWYGLKDNVDKPEKKITKIIICGENFGESFVSYLSNYNNTPTTLGNVWTNVFDLNDVVPEISFDESLKYATAVGLALPSKVLI